MPDGPATSDNPLSRFSTPQLLVAGGGLALVIFSFFPWFEFSRDSESAWGTFPLLTWPAIFGGFSALVVVGDVFKFFSPRRLPWGFTWTQYHLVAALVSLLITIGVLIEFSDEKLGFMLSVVAAITLTVGSIMMAGDEYTSS